MPGNPKECREHAKRCWALAAETKNPALKESLVEIAQKWARLATDLEATRALLADWAPEKPKKAG
jgi:hypothetical protein